MDAGEFVDTALRMRACGFSVYPTETRGDRRKQPHARALIASGHWRWKVTDGRERQVATWKPLQSERATEEHIRIWADQGARGLALVTGWLSGVVIFDFDGAEGRRYLEEAELEPHVLTPSGGAHLYYRHPGWPVKTCTGVRAGAAVFDVRGDGGAAMLPPTLTDRGEYVRTGVREWQDRALTPLTWLEAGGLFEAPPPPPPRRRGALTLWRDQSGDRLDIGVLLGRAADVAQQRGRNEGGFWLGQQLRDNDYAVHEALGLYHAFLDMVGGVNTKGHPEEYTLREFENSVHSAFRGRKREAWGAGRP